MKRTTCNGFSAEAGGYTSTSVLSPWSLQSVLIVRPPSRFNEDIQDNKEKQTQQNRLKCLLKHATDTTAVDHQTSITYEPLLSTTYRSLSDYQELRHSFYRLVATLSTDWID
ncbi:hypothetical protein Tsp_01033 [Trichinella spiralis]|uniref:Uncharacterized protein n=1 Tax=Trichinella spiralis TaxID=6334 RepID=E5SBA8_TRISP|nr:hypothetical protein Tsp_01033 [Trichinella spiralis]KRY29463.1 hypothetical protein T01_5785 [Trichinella spiralis]